MNFLSCSLTPKPFYVSNKKTISEAINELPCPIATKEAKSLLEGLKFEKKVNLLFKDRYYQVFSNMKLIGTRNSILIVQRGKATSFCTRHPIVGVYDDKFNREAVDVYSLLPKLAELGFKVQSRWSFPILFLASSMQYRKERVCVCTPSLSFFTRKNSPPSGANCYS